MLRRVLTEAERDQLTAAVTRLEAALPPSGMPRTRALLDRARDVLAGLPVGMTARGLIDRIERSCLALEARIPLTGEPRAAADPGWQAGGQRRQ